GTLAGQIVMEGFLNLKLKPWIRRLLTRGLAIIPALAITISANEDKLGELLLFSQVVLSMQLSFAVFPLVYFTSKKDWMGMHANSKFIQIVAYGIAFVIGSLNLWLLYTTFSS
ncbi:MAG: divalent metal cation transporter, partial [Bacteroidia bacterium]|nr:divalent metal cation transporter [Bacteroidia bacterium]